MATFSDYIKNFFTDDKKTGFFLFIIHFLGLLFILEQACNSRIRFSDLEILPGVVGYFPETKKVIIWYVLSVPSLFIFWISGILYKNIFWNKAKSFFSFLRSKKVFYCFIISVIALNTMFVLSNYGSGNTWLFFLVLWLFSYLFPLIFPKKISSSFFEKPFVKKHFYSVSAIICLLYFTWMLQPFIIDKLKIMNEYWDIPTETMLKNGDSLNNTDYINENHLIGFHNKADVHTLAATGQQTIFADVPYKTGMADYIKNYRENETSYFSPFIYEKNKGIAFVIQLNAIEITELLVMDWTNEERSLIKNSIKEVDLAQKNLVKKRRDKKFQTTTSSFIRNQEYEIMWQVYNRWYIHHHNHLIAPINELALGKPLKNIFMQYGFLNSYFLAKTLFFINQINYGSYQKLLFSFYIVYIILLIILVWTITKKIQFVSIALLTVVSSFNFLTFHYFYMDAGLNPIRHIFDLPLFFCWYLYLESNKKIYFIISLLLCLVAVLNNIQFGLILTIALVISIFAKNIKHIIKNPLNFDFILAVVTFMCSLVIAYLFQQGSIGITVGFLSGILNLPIPTYAIIITTSVIMLSYFLFFFINKENKTLSYMFFLILLYSQGLLVFWFRSFAYYHMLPFMAVYVILAIIALKVMTDKYKKTASAVLFFIMSALLILFAFSITKYTKTMRSFNRVLDANKLYSWTMPGSNFISDINPAYFEDSIALIKKYSPDEKSICLISKYDNFIPIISQRYNILPVIDLQWYLTTKNDFENIVDYILAKSPKYIFADKDLETRNFEFDIINIDSRFRYLHGESMLRVQRMKQIQRLFKTVSFNYAPLESSQLLTVYERKDY